MDFAGMKLTLRSMEPVRRELTRPLVKASLYVGKSVQPKLKSSGANLPLYQKHTRCYTWRSDHSTTKEGKSHEEEGEHKQCQKD